jgi:branched-chain amino acid transport system permease protein
MTNALPRTAAIALLVLLAIVPLVVQGTYYPFLGIIVFIYGIVAVGLNILAGYAGQFSLGHAALMAMGAYTTALVSKSLAPVPYFAASGLHIWLGVLAGTLMAAAFGALLAFPALRVRGPYLAMVTIAFGWVIFKVLQEWVTVTGGDLGLASIPKAQVGSYRFDTHTFYYAVLALFVLALGLQYRLVTSELGLRIRAMKHNEIAVSSLGIDVYRLKVLVFVISASFAGFGGTLFAHQQNYISPDNFQFFSSVFFLLAVLFGGAGTLLGPVIGAAVLTLLPELLHDLEKYRLIVYGGFILVTLYFLPNGVMGLFSRRGRTFLGDAAISATSGSELPRTDGAELKLRSVAKRFGGLRALHELNLHVERGSIHALIGPNGAGKTTVINLVTGFYRADAGAILIDDRSAPVASMHHAAREGVVRTFQTIKLFGDLTVLEHVLVGCACHAHSSVIGSIFATASARRAHSKNLASARALIHFVGLSAYENTPANALAYGHRRLLEIARALAARPRLILLDEPAAGLVAEEIRRLATLIRRLKESGMTVLLIEHHIELVSSVADRATVLDHGVVIADGAPAAIQRDERVIAAYLGAPHAVA